MYGMASKITRALRVSASDSCHPVLYCGLLTKSRTAMSTLSLVAIALSFFLVPAPLSAQARFTGLGFFGGHESSATDVSADGRVVVGFSEPNMFRWTRDTSIVRPAIDRAAVSADGSVVVATMSNPEYAFEAFRWVIGESFTPLGDLPGGAPFPVSRALGVSDDGRTVVGIGVTSAGEQAVRWTPEAGMLGLAGTASRAHGVSADGSVIVGYVADQAVRWTTPTTMLPLPRPPGTRSSEANAVSADGRVVVGVNVFVPLFDAGARAQAFRWTQQEGMVLLGDLPGSRVYSIAYDLSADGSVIVGSGTTLRPDGADTEEAFYWNRQSGMLNLKELLIRNGATNLEGWRLSEARGVSADGLTVVGTGIHDGRIEAFTAFVPEPSTVVLAAFAAALVLALSLRGGKASAL